MAVLGRFGSICERILKYKKWQFSASTALCTSELSLCNKSNLPIPPKRPATAYLIFCKENREAAVRDNPGLKSPEVVKILAAKWALLTPVLKKPYEDTARENTIIYGRMHKEFYENLTEEQKGILAKIKENKRELKKIFQIKKELRESGFPKAPSNAYTIFVKSRSKGINAIKEGRNFIKQAAEEWKKMSEDEKEVFYAKAKEERESFQKLISSWEGQDGHLALLKDYTKQKSRLRSMKSLDAPTIKHSSPKTKKSPEAIEHKASE